MDCSNIKKSVRGQSVLGLPEEAIRDAKEAFEIYDLLGDELGQALSLYDLAWARFDEQLDAAENDALRSFELSQGEGKEFLACKTHRLLSNIYRSKGEKEKAIHHLKKAQEIAAPSNWHGQLIRIHYNLAELFLGEDEFDEANVNIERTKSYAVNDAHSTGRARRLQAEVWYGQGRVEDASSEASSALEVFEKLGSTKEAVACRDLLQKIGRAKVDQCVRYFDSEYYSGKPFGNDFASNIC